MDRRHFLKRAITGTTVAGSTLALGSVAGFWNRPATAAEQQQPWDMVAIRGGQPDEMFDAAIAAYGGMKRFVPRGSRVVVKPNIGWDVPPERAANTNPVLVGRIVQHCRDAGAREVIVFDHTCDNWRQCYANSGIQAAVEAAGGTMLGANSSGYYTQVPLQLGKRLTTTDVHKTLQEADVLINVPVLKNHSSSTITAAMKNMMGAVWDRWYFHRNDLHQCIADLASLRTPDLTVLDAYNVLMRNGPRGVSVDDVVQMQAQVLSTDMVAVDAAGARLYGLQPEDVRHIVIADQMGLGRMDLSQLAINRIKLS